MLRQIDQKSSQAIETAPIGLLKAFVTHIAAPVAVLEIIYKDDCPVDLKLLFFSSEYVSNSCLAKFLKPEEAISVLLEKTWSELGFPGEYLPTVCQEFHEISQSGQRKELSGERGKENVTIGFPLLGKYVGFINESTSFSSRRRAETEIEKKNSELQQKIEALAVAESRFTKLFEANILGICLGKLDGTITDANDKFLETIKWTRQEAFSPEEGKDTLSWMRITPQDDPRSNVVVEHLPQLFTTGVMGPFENIVLRPNGEQVPILGASTISSWDKKNVPNSSSISYIIDLSETKKAESALINAREEAILAREEAIAASKAKSNFLSTMSHELRTPLAGILGAQTLLLDTIMDREQKDLVEASIRSGQGLLSLLGDVLDLSKIEAGRVSLNMAPFDLREAIEESVMLVGELANRKGLELITFFDASVIEAFESLSGNRSKSSSLQAKARDPLMVVSDMQRLRQIIINLVGNSIKFTETGSVTVKISAMNKGIQLKRKSWGGPVQSSPSVSFSGNAGDECLSSTPSEVMQELSYERSSSINLSRGSSIDVSRQSSATLSLCGSSSEELPLHRMSEPDSDDILRILVEVQDTGCGISVAKQKMLFKPFSQVEASANRRFEGAGLGLSICKQLLTLMGGSIGIRSKLGEGSTFFFDLPLFVEQHQPEEAELSADHQSLGDPKELKFSSLGQNIAAAEDDCDILQSLNCLLVTSTNGASSSAKVFLDKNNIKTEALPVDSPAILEAIRNRKFDILIMSMNSNFKPILQLLQDMAQEVASQLDTRWKTLPILVLGFRDGLSARRRVPGIENLQFSASCFKPIRECTLLDNIVRTYKNHLQLSEGAMDATVSRRGSVRVSACESDLLGSSLELYRIANHISENSFKCGSKNADEPESPLTSPLEKSRSSSVLIDFSTFKRTSSAHQEAMFLGERPEAGALLINANDCPLSPVAATRVSSFKIKRLSEPSPASSHSSLASPTAQNSVANQPILILLAEDTILLSKIAKRLIETRLDNVRVIVVENGEEAVEAADKHMREKGATYPIIWMDVMMPLMDGLLATREIRRLERSRGLSDPALRSYIVALTADLNSETAQLCKEVEMDDKLSKPLQAATLLAVYAKAMQARNLLRTPLISH